jgi:outer membrane protein assembly factor BamB
LSAFRNPRASENKMSVMAVGGVYMLCWLCTAGTTQMARKPHRLIRDSVIRAFILACNIAVFAAALCHAEWSQFQFDSSKQAAMARAKVTQLAPQFEADLLSGETTGETVFTTSSAVARGVTSCIGTKEGDIFTVAAKTGFAAWQVGTNGPIAGAPLVHGNTVVVASTDGTLLALDGTANGAELWRFTAPAPLAGSPTFAVVGGQPRLYVTTTIGNLYALRLDDGELEWSATVTGSLWGSPSYGEARNRIYLGNYDGSLYAYAATTGKAEWATDPSTIPLGPVRATVPVQGNRLYIATLTEGLFCIEDTSTGPQERWRSPETGSITGSPAVVPSTGLASAVIYVANDDGYLFAIEDHGSSGVLVWTRSVGARVAGSVAYADGKVFVASEAGALHAFRADTGADWATANMKAPCDSSLAISKGRVYALDGAGILYAFGNTLDPPEGLSAVAQSIGQVHLSWTPVSLPPIQTPVSGYGIYRSASPDGDLIQIGYINSRVVDGTGQPTGLTASTYVDTTITASGVYYYAVTALNEMTGQPPMEESTYSDLAWAEVTAPPSPPSGLATEEGDMHITLRWESPIGRDIAWIRIYRREGLFGDLILTRTVNGAENELLDIKVEAGISYGYALQSVDESGNAGPLCETVWGTPFLLDWPQYGRTAAHSSFDPSLSLGMPLAVHWSVTLSAIDVGGMGGQYEAGAPLSINTDAQNCLVAGGKVYVAGSGGVITAMSASDGSVLWQRIIPGYLGTTPIACHMGLIYALGAQGLYTLDADNGAWTWSITGSLWGSHDWAPTIYRGVIYASELGLGYALRAVDIEGKRIMWNGVPQEDEKNPNPAMPATYLESIFTLRAGNVQMYDANTGLGLRVASLGAQPVLYVPAVIGYGTGSDYLLLVDMPGNVHAYDPANIGIFETPETQYFGMERLWNIRYEPAIPYAPALAGMLAIVTYHGKGMVYGIRLADGGIEWTCTLDGVAKSPPMILGSHAYVSSSDGHLYVINAITGNVSGKAVIGAAPEGNMSAGSGLIFVPCDGGTRIVALGPGVSAPGGLTVAPGIGTVTLSWGAPVHTYPISAYAIYSSVDPENGWGEPVVIIGPQTSCIVTSEAGQITYWSVRARDSRGIWSDYSLPVAVKAFHEPDIVATISAPSEGDEYCVTGTLTITVTGTAKSGNFIRYTLEIDGQIAHEGNAPVEDGPLGAVTVTRTGNAVIRLTVYDETGETGQAVRNIVAPVVALTAQVEWPPLGTVLVSDCGQVPFSLTVMGVAKGEHFTGYRLELARLSATHIIISSTAYETPVETADRLGVVVLPDCDSYVLRVVSSDTCGRTRTSEMQIELESGSMLVASIITFSTRGKDPGEHRKPTDVAVDREGYIWVVDTLNRRIQKYTALGRYLFETGLKETGISEGLTFREPVAAEVDSANRILVLDRQDGTIKRLNEDGELVDAISGDFNHPEGLGIDEQGLIYVADTLNNRIVVLNQEGVPQFSFGTEGDGPGQFSHPTGVRLDALSGNIVVTDTGNNRVQLFSSSGLYLSGFGTQGTAPDQFSHPYETTAGAFHNMFTSDMTNNRIAWRTLFGTMQNLITLIPPAGYGGELFKHPHGLDTDDEESMLYVADTGNDRIVGIRIRTDVPDTIQPRAVLVSPATGATVWGTVEVKGIAADAYFERYELEYGIGDSPEAYRLIATSNEPVWGGQLALWDTAALSAGTYVLRLTVSDKSGNQSQALIRVVLQGTTPPLIANVSAMPVPFMPDRSGLTIGYCLSAPAEVRLVIQDSDSGLPIWRSETLVAGGKGGQLGANNLLWDGRDEQGKVAPPGQYTVVLVARAGDVRDRRAVMVEAAMSPELQAALHNGPVSGSGVLPTGSALTGNGSATGSVPNKSAPTSSSPTSPLTGSHDRGVGNGENPKGFIRDDNPGKHGGN